jgi:EAL domain-containing protein (putative c-di-GMP-specific phosphodiesterase class I)
MSPENIVFEINEREAITNWEIFEKNLSYYLNMGFSVALDDAGAGYSSFETILKIKPHYIKIDMGIIRDVQNDIVKQQIVKSLVAINNSINGVIIAEGIQTIEECVTLKELGVTQVRAFYSRNPMPVFRR